MNDFNFCQSFHFNKLLYIGLVNPFTCRSIIHRCGINSSLWTNLSLFHKRLSSLWKVWTSLHYTLICFRECCNRIVFTPMSLFEWCMNTHFYLRNRTTLHVYIQNYLQNEWTKSHLHPPLCMGHMGKIVFTPSSLLAGYEQDFIYTLISIQR